MVLVTNAKKDLKQKLIDGKKITERVNVIHEEAKKVVAEAECKKEKAKKNAPMRF